MKLLSLGACHLWVQRSPWGMNVKLYMKYSTYWTADVKSSSYDPHSYESNLCNCVYRSLKKVITSTGFRRVTSLYRCDALTNWAMKALTLGARHLWALRSPWEMNIKLCVKYFTYWTADVKSSSYDPRSYESNLCNCVYRSLKKSGLQQGLNPWLHDSGARL